MSENIFKRKRILFLANKSFGYESDIKSKMEYLGAIVDYFDERPSNSFLTKALIRINRNFLGYYIKKYYRKIQEKTANNNYDYIIVIKCESISKSIIEAFKKEHPQAKLVLYLWDSINNNKNALVNYQYFDKVLSFDTEDVVKYGFKFRPLFYIDLYKAISSAQNVKYDALFVGTVHSDRYEFVKNVEKNLAEKNKKIYSYFFFRSIILYYKKKLGDKSYSKTKKSDFHFTSLNKEELLSLVSESACLIDIQHPKQTGLTMRTIEALGARRKLITTNLAIKEYDFYNPNNILVVDRKNPVISTSFLESPYEEIDNKIYYQYSIESWLIDLIKFH